MKIFKKLIDILSQAERKQACLLMGMILIMAILDMVGVASILPFIAILANPEVVETNIYLKKLFNTLSVLGIGTNQQFLFVIGVLMVVLLIFSLTFKAFTTYIQLRFSLMREHSIGKRLLEGYLQQPYTWFLHRHSSSLGKTVLSEVWTVVSNGIMPSLVIVAQGAIVIALITLLVVVDPYLALAVGVVLSSAYIIIFIGVSKFLSRIGLERLNANEQRFAVISEVFSAVKEVKLGGLEEEYVKRFEIPAEIYARNTAAVQVVAQIPRFFLEMLAFGGIVLLILVLMARENNVASALPVIALYAFAGYRLMPALQLIYGAITQLRFVSPALDKLHHDLMDLPITTKRDISHEVIRLEKGIVLSEIHYQYPEATRAALKNLNLIIPARNTIGIVGTTGSGKTTLIDLILGLLDIQRGTLTVDDQVITENNRISWQRLIGYVPQHIYLTDDTVSANIALGCDKSNIDLVAVERASRIANLHEFVIKDLPQQYETKVGERGVRLSGGQRQRIGIARALYHCPQVLILDEATSALDNLTEQAVMDAIHNLGRNITIIMIAHRLTTLTECDNIFVLEAGELIGQGKFNELNYSNGCFRALADT